MNRLIKSLTTSALSCALLVGVTAQAMAQPAPPPNYNPNYQAPPPGYQG